ncbi:hypothetical protein AB6A40_011304 [Gnathostoma spinigerum]|uniref:Peptidase C2 calpain large subunit domain-containing protein n=1 Tax=Gnathostoma spinigerum TaxID=75299 RepID=A0ABD6EYR2_9BILA
MFRNLIQVSCRFRLTGGSYVVIPSTFHPDINGDFMLRIYTNGSFSILSQQAVTEQRFHIYLKASEINFPNETAHWHFILSVTIRLV